jgi:hypothetical protein
VTHCRRVIGKRRSDSRFRGNERENRPESEI